jgi:hypothetical protein
MNAVQFAEKIGAPNAGDIIVARHLSSASGMTEAVMRAEIEAKANKWVAAYGGWEETVDSGMASALMNAGAREVSWAELEQLRYESDDNAD